MVDLAHITLEGWWRCPEELARHVRAFLDAAESGRHRRGASGRAPQARRHQPGASGRNELDRVAGEQSLDLGQLAIGEEQVGSTYDAVHLGGAA